MKEQNTQEEFAQLDVQLSQLSHTTHEAPAHLAGKILARVKDEPQERMWAGLSGMFWARAATTAFATILPLVLGFSLALIESPAEELQVDTLLYLSEYADWDESPAEFTQP